jgi:hypothetical protein
MAKVSVRIRKPAASESTQPTEEIRQVEEGSEIEVNEGETVEEMEDPIPPAPAEPAPVRNGVDISPTAPPLPGDPQHIIEPEPEPVYVINETHEEQDLHALNEGAKLAPPVNRSRHRVR